jgi:large subunit ribosomal protein L13
LITHAVRGMVPKNRLGRVLMTKLKVYKGSEHPHAAQQPAKLTPAK